MTAETTATCLRLTGEVADATAVFNLPAGQYTVGSRDGSDVLLPVAGVSRRHALLKVTGNAIDLEDGGSKNGTFVNGERVERATVRAGDWVAFGPAVLYVAEIDRDDAEVAIPVGRRAGNGSRPVAEEDTATHARRAEDEPPRWVSLLNKLTDQLIGNEEPDPEVALTALRLGLGADGAYLLECSGQGEPLVLCASGAAFELSREGALRGSMAAISEAGEIEPVILSGTLDEEPRFAWAGAAAPGVQPCGIIVCGDFPHRAAAGPLLESALRLLVHARQAPVHLGAVVEPRTPPGLRFAKEHVAGESRAMRSVHDQVRQLLRGDIPVLISGETGVGKELIAKLLHRSSERSGGPFVAVNCAAIPSELLEAELFGIERGVATGVDGRQGKFQIAEGGILFLDEIADMSADLQAKLLRALQEMEITPVGGRRPIPVDVRVLSATNSNLEKKLVSGEFRRDLYYRIAGFTLSIPPLRDRRDDIPGLVEQFMRWYAEEIGKPIRGITVKALNALCNAPWPGNVRELEHEVRRLVYLCPEDRAIDSHMLSEAVLFPTVQLHLDSLDLASDLHLETRVSDLERKLITVALARTRGNRSKAAKLLGISRNGLALKMERLGLV